MRDDLVLQAEQQPDLDRRLRGGVVGVPRFAEAPGRGADEHEVAVTRALDLAEERARGEERRGEVRAQRLLPALERELPHGLVRRRPDAGDRGADIDAAELLAACANSASTSRLDGEVGAEHRRAAELRGDCLCALASAVVVHDHPRALGRERPRARGADTARGAGDERRACLRGRCPRRESSLPACASTSSATSKASPASSSGGRRPAATRRCTTKAARSTPRRSTPPCAARRRPARRRSSSWTATAPAATTTFNSLAPRAARSRLRVRRAGASGRSTRGSSRQGCDAALFVGMHAKAGHARRRALAHGLGPGLARPALQRRSRSARRHQRRALRPLGLPGAARHRRPRDVRRGARAARRRAHDGRGEGRPRPLQRADRRRRRRRAS